MISFDILPKNEAENILPSLFRILHSNMSVIAPTGNSYKEDYRLWFMLLPQHLKRMHDRLF